MATIADDTPATPPDDDDLVPLLPPRRLKDDTEMDITPMIDCTFLLLIFFIVTSSPDAQTALNLAPAQHGVGVSIQNSIIVSIAKPDDEKPADIYLADGKVGEPIAGTPGEQETRIREAIEAAKAEGKATVLLKAEKNVTYNEVNRVSTVVGSVEGMKLNYAVMEVD